MRPEQPTRRRIVAAGAAAGALVWTAPVILSSPVAAGGTVSGLTLGPNVVLDPGFDIP